MDPKDSTYAALPSTPSSRKVEAAIEKTRHRHAVVSVSRVTSHSLRGEKNYLPVCENSLPVFIAKLRKPLAALANCIERLPRERKYSRENA